MSTFPICLSLFPYSTLHNSNSSPHTPQVPISPCSNPTNLVSYYHHIILIKSSQWVPISCHLKSKHISLAWKPTYIHSSKRPQSPVWLLVTAAHRWASLLPRDHPKDVPIPGFCLVPLSSKIKWFLLLLLFSLSLYLTQFHLFFKIWNKWQSLWQHS